MGYCKILNGIRVPELTFTFWMVPNERFSRFSDDRAACTIGQIGGSGGVPDWRLPDCCQIGRPARLLQAPIGHRATDCQTDLRAASHMCMPFLWDTGEPRDLRCWRLVLFELAYNFVPIFR